MFGGHFHNLSLEYFSPCLGFLCLSTLLSWHWSCPKGLSSLTPSTPPQTLDHFSLPLPNLAGTEPRGWILSKNCQGHGIPASRSAVLTSPHSCSGWTSTATTLLPQGTLPKAFHSTVSSSRWNQPSDFCETGESHLEPELVSQVDGGCE